MNEQVADLDRVARQPAKQCLSLPVVVTPVRVRLLLQLVEEYNGESGRLSFLLRGVAPLVAQVDGVDGISPLTKEIAGYIAPDGEQVLDELIAAVAQHGIDPVAVVQRASYRCRLHLAAIAHLAGQLLNRGELPPAADPPIRTVWGAALAQQHNRKPHEPLAFDLPTIRTALFAAFTPAPDHPPAPVTDGPYGGCWCIVKGVKHRVPGGLMYRLIEHFWTRDHATYTSLFGTVFTGRVLEQSVRSKTSELTKVLKRIGVAWRLRANTDPHHPGGGYVTRHTPDAK